MKRALSSNTFKLIVYKSGVHYPIVVKRPVTRQMLHTTDFVNTTLLPVVSCFEDELLEVRRPLRKFIGEEYTVPNRVVNLELSKLIATMLFLVKFVESGTIVKLHNSNSYMRKFLEKLFSGGEDGLVFVNESFVGPVGAVVNYTTSLESHNANAQAGVPNLVFAELSSTFTHFDGTLWKLPFCDIQVCALVFTTLMRKTHDYSLIRLLKEYSIDGDSCYYYNPVVGGVDLYVYGFPNNFSHMYVLYASYLMCKRIGGNYLKEIFLYVMQY